MLRFLLPFACALPLAAQSPLTTTFVSSTFLAATTGVTVYFDLDVNTAIDVNQIDANFYGAAGPQVRIEVWGRVGTHVGFNTSAAGWTLLGVSNTVSSNGRDVATPCPFPTPFRLQPGVNGIAVQHFGAGAAYTAGTSVGAVYSQTSEVVFKQGGSSNPPIFGGTQNAPRVMNCSIHYVPVGGFASASDYGAGCGGAAEPLLTSTGRPAIGNTGFSLDAFTPQGSVAVLFAIGITAGQYQVAPGCDLLLGDIALAAVTVGSTAGCARFPLAVPADNSLRGVRLHAQAVTLDAGIALSAGLRIEVGD